jgi:glucose-1-phosphate thymidylyltransferase
MQAQDDTPLSAEQVAAASSGAKGAMPVGVSGRPFLDYILTAIADAGFTDVCLVVGQHDDVIRARYGESRRFTRLRVSFAVQPAPIGTADALLASEEFVAGEQFVVLNSDNYYPIDGLRMLREADGPAMLAFSRRGLLRDGQIQPERLARYAALEIDADGYLTNVVEKPADATLVEREDAAISMNVWRFSSEIFRACRDVQPSPRGELELPMAVALAIRVLGMRVRAIRIDAPVLDLSHRADIPAVAARLDAIRVQL